MFAVNNFYIHRNYAVNMFLHQLKKWPTFIWDSERLAAKLGAVRYRQGKILGQMQAMGFRVLEETMLQALTLDVVKSSEIEGELLNIEEVRSSIARRLGIDAGGMVVAGRDVEGVVELMLDATQGYDKVLDDERLFGWHEALFPTGRSGMHRIKVGAWRDGPMEVVSGGMGKEQVHFTAPSADKMPAEMKVFLDWFNATQDIDPVLKAAIAHLWFLTIHPFDDGNGRVARAIADMQLAKADGSAQRFYSMSAQIQKERNAYYQILERTQRSGDLDITDWLEWFLDCLFNSMEHTQHTIEKIIERGRFWEVHKQTQINIRQQQMLHVLLDDFFGKLNVSKWAMMTKTSTDTALRDIQDLLKKGILEQEEAGGRSTSYKLK